MTPLPQAYTMTSLLPVRRSTHRHALRAALAVTGRARRPLLLCCVLMGGISACVVQDDAAPHDSWSLDEDAPPDIVKISDMNAVEDMSVTEDMSVAVDMGPRDMRVSSTPDMQGVDASPEQDMWMEIADMPADLDSPDLEQVESCLDEEGHTDWECCERTALEGQGCELCSESSDPDQPLACLSCLNAQGQWNECCERLGPLLDDSIVDFNPLGCSAWGPPSPPSRGGLTLRGLGVM